MEHTRNMVTTSGEFLQMDVRNSPNNLRPLVEAEAEADACAMAL